MLGLFNKAEIDSGKILVVDEAHKVSNRFATLCCQSIKMR